MRRQNWIRHNVAHWWEMHCVLIDSEGCAAPLDVVLCTEQQQRDGDAEIWRVILAARTTAATGFDEALVSFLRLVFAVGLSTTFHRGETIERNRVSLHIFEEVYHASVHSFHSRSQLL